MTEPTKVSKMELPTDDEIAAAAVIMADVSQINRLNWVGYAVGLIAQALADQRAKYEAVAADIDRTADGKWNRYDLRAAAERIRQVSQ